MTVLDLNSRVPIRLEPIPGESFDSWLAAYASRLDCPITVLAQAIGVTAATVGMPAANLALGRPAPDPEIVGRAAAGLDPAQIEATWRPLARYAQTVKARLGRSDLAYATRPLPFSRYCPQCLKSSAGRWLAAWRLPWFVACPHHDCLLRTACPDCGAAQRSRQLHHDPHATSTAVCSAGRPTKDDTDNRCRRDLGAAQPALSPPARLLIWQAELAAVLDGGIDDASLTGLVDRLIDQVVLAWHLGLRPETFDSAAAADTADIATHLHHAQRIQTDPAGTEMRELAQAHAKQRPSPLPRSWKAASPELTRTVLGHRDRRLRTADRLRYRSATDLAARPDIHAAGPRTHGLPIAIWADWAIRLTPATGTHPNSYRAITAAAIRLAGTSQSIQSVTQPDSADPNLAAEIIRGFQLVGRHPASTTIIATLTLLADHLDRHGAPIDYRRRERVAARVELIDPDSWDVICRAAATPTGRTPKLRAARLWIWEKITGGEPRQAPDHLRPETSAQLDHYHQFALELPPTAVTLLDHHTRTLLDRHGCTDEPLTWSPQPTSIHLDALPGPDPESVDPAEAHHLLHKHLAAGTVAAQLRITLDHLRFIIRRHPTPPHPPPARKRRVIRHPTPAHLTGAQLSTMLDNGDTIRGIASENGVTRRTIRAELIRHDIAVPTPGRPPNNRIDAEWVRHQYLIERRTLPDIAAEANTTPTTIANIARAAGIPLRPRGGASHQSALTAGRDYPHPLNTAVAGQGGIERVRRFQIYATARSLNTASARTGLNGKVLASQLTQLESACGGQLIRRSRRNDQAQQLTDLGQLLLRQADHHLSPNPASPPRLPEPLASAINAFWGPSRLSRFLTTASCPTVTDAAQQVGTNVHTLRHAIRRLGEAVGGPLLVETAPRAATQLTPLGTELLHQAHDHADDLRPPPR